MKIYKRVVLCIVAVAMCGSACFIRRNYANEQLISADTKIEIAETEIAEPEISNLNVNTDKTETEVVLETVLETTAEVTEEILTETTFSASTENLKTIKHNSELSNFIASWENSNLFNYENNKEFESFEQINEYVMPNSKFYIITKDEDNCLNVGYGICLRSNGQWLNQSYFSEYEVDITKLTEGDVISADIVKRVHEDIISEIRNFVKKKMEKNGIELLGTQLDALTAIVYQFGMHGANLNGFCECYLKYGNSEGLRENYCTLGGTYPFIQVRGGQNSEGFTRADANWHLFTNDSYIYG